MIFAIEDDIVFDRSYASNMKLPFDKGWDRWAVFARNGDTFQKVFESTDYRACERFLTQ